MPEDLAPDELTLERAAELLEHPSSDRVLGDDPGDGQDGDGAGGRFGPYVQLGEAADGGRKAADGVAAQDDDRAGRHASRRRCGSCSSRGRSAPIPRRARRSSQPTAGSGRS